MEGQDYLSELIQVIRDTLCPTLDVRSDVAALSAPSMIDAALVSARKLVGEDIVYDQELFDSLGCEEFTPEHYEMNDKALRDGVSLDAILSRAIAPHLCKAGSERELRGRFEGLNGNHTAVDVLCHGARDYMAEGYVPNGGRECQFGASYKKYRPICNENLLNLVKAGRAVAFSLDTLKESGLITELHISPLLAYGPLSRVKSKVEFAFTSPSGLQHSSR